jgi:hypothetical protein
MNREELLKNAKPILFNTEMVQAILEGRKTVTRRVLKHQPVYEENIAYMGNGVYRFEHYGFDLSKDWPNISLAKSEGKNIPFEVGDILYVRETWSIHECVKCRAGIPALGGECKCKYVYRASYGATDFRWKPSIHMPKKAARIFLKVTDVRVERLQDITEEDAIAEGMSKTLVDGVVFISAKGNFHVFWDSLNIKRGYGWDTNPWVWVIEFEKIEREEE